MNWTHRQKRILRPTPAECMGLGIGLGFGGGGSAVPFSPGNVSGAKAWFRADLGVTGTTTVTQWVDQIGSGNATAGGGTEPSLTASFAALNNRPTITFTGSQKIVTPSWGASQEQPHTLFVVAKMGAGSKYLIDNLGPNDPGQCAVFSTNGAVTLYAGGGGLSVGGDITLASIIICEFNGASTKCYINARTPVATGNAGANGFDGLSIGNYGSGGSFANSDIAEVLVYNGINATVRGQLWDYASVRYGIAVGA